MEMSGWDFDMSRDEIKVDLKRLIDQLDEDVKCKIAKCHAAGAAAQSAFVCLFRTGLLVKMRFGS